MPEEMACILFTDLVGSTELLSGLARDLIAQALATARELGLGNVERRGAALIEGGPGPR